MADKEANRRAEHVAALKRERDFLVQSGGRKERIAHVDERLAEFGEKPPKRGRQTAAKGGEGSGDDNGAGEGTGE